MRKPLILCMSVAGFLFAVGQNAWAQERPRRPRDPQKLFERFDKNGDGKITEDEFPGPAKRFQMLDKNGDGVLEPEEFTRRGFGRRMPMLGLLSRLFENVDRDQIFDELDANHDGVVTRDEFKNAQLGKILGEALRAAFEKVGGSDALKSRGRGRGLFNRLDKNGDGQITPDEFPRGQEQFDRLDKNGDGVLSEDELLAGFRALRRRRQQ